MIEYSGSRIIENIGMIELTSYMSNYIDNQFNVSKISSMYNNIHCGVNVSNVQWTVYNIFDGSWQPIRWSHHHYLGCIEHYSEQIPCNEKVEFRYPRKNKLPFSNQSRKRKNNCLSNSLWINWIPLLFNEQQNAPQCTWYLFVLPMKCTVSLCHHVSAHIFFLLMLFIAKMTKR